jgi:uncharacterized protein YbaA (DUF1428 family)
MPYVDGYIVPVPAKNLAEYRKLARKAGKIWIEHGALQYRECVGDDMNVAFGLPFPKALKLKKGETAVFSWIVFKSKAERDRINARAMADPRMHFDPKKMPFDTKRMLYGGFKMMVDL